MWPFPLWSAAATAFLLRPSDALAREVADELAQFKGGAPDAAIHIRHCDKGVEAMLHPVPAYLELLPDSLPHPAQVLLVTDDHDIYRESHHLESNGAADRFVVHRDASAEALRECTWCGEMPGNAGTSECFMRHQARTLLDLHTMARAPIAALTFSSNFAHLLIELQLFTHSFCASVVSVDNYIFALGTGRAFLAADNTSASADGDAGASTGAVSVRRQVTVVRTKDDGRVAMERVLPPQGVARIAIDAAEQLDPWANAISCDPSIIPPGVDPEPPTSCRVSGAQPAVVAQENDEELMAVASVAIHNSSSGRLIHEETNVSLAVM